MCAAPGANLGGKPVSSPASGDFKKGEIMFGYELRNAVALRDMEIEQEAERLVRERGMALWTAMERAEKIVRERRRKEHTRKNGFIK